MTRAARIQILRLAAAALLVVGLGSGRAQAFHSGGVGDCDGCHSMHNSFDGSAVTGTQSGPFLLKGSDQSSMCLYCHEAAGVPTPRAYFISTASADLTPGSAPVQLTPGGDFGWLKKTYSWAVSGQVQMSLGERHGHNIVATDYGYQPDVRNALAPGGTYPSSALACSSCHDPHGRYRRLADGSVGTTGLPIFDSGSYAESTPPRTGVSAVGSYRMLAGIGYQPRSLNGGFAFAFPPPMAISPSSYNRSESVTQTRVAYGQGMSEWCANCHTSMIQGGRTVAMASLLHPAGAAARLGPGIVSNYDAYVKTGNVSNVDATRAYWSLVPFEEGANSTYVSLLLHARSDDTFLNGPDTNSTVSCMTCHRAHASGFDSMTRFRVGNDFITVGNGSTVVWPDPASNPAQAQGRSAAETQRSYYDRPATLYAPYQAQLCNKCHVKD